MLGLVKCARTKFGRMRCMIFKNDCIKWSSRCPSCCLLRFKASRSAQPFKWKWVPYFHENRAHFHLNGWGLGLALKPRQTATRKCPCHRDGVKLSVFSTLRRDECPCQQGQPRDLQPDWRRFSLLKMFSMKNYLNHWALQKYHYNHPTSWASQSVALQISISVFPWFVRGCDRRLILTCT